MRAAAALRAKHRAARGWLSRALWAPGCRRRLTQGEDRVQFERRGAHGLYGPESVARTFPWGLGGAGPTLSRRQDSHELPSLRLSVPSFGTQWAPCCLGPTFPRPCCRPWLCSLSREGPGGAPVPRLLVGGQCATETSEVPAREDCMVSHAPVRPHRALTALGCGDRHAHHTWLGDPHLLQASRTRQKGGLAWARWLAWPGVLGPHHRPPFLLESTKELETACTRPQQWRCAPGGRWAEGR